LEATGRLLDRVGYESTTTTAIAKEAGTSVGTVYEYFRDRDALIRALLERYRGRLRDTVLGVLAGADLASWRTLAASAVDTFAEFYRREPGYRVLWLESLTTPALREAGTAWGEEFGALLDEVFGQLLPGVRAAERRAVARTSMYIVSGLTSMALAGPADLLEPTLRETKRALESYLATVIEERPRHIKR
jgi:AcrR family transcriptional regulator